MATSGIADIRTARDGSLQLPGGFGDYLLQNSFRETVWKSKWGRLMTYAPEYEKEFVN